MTTTEFAYWLNGFVELGGERPTEDQWELIKEHLALVFKKETRSLVDIQIPVDKNGIMTVGQTPGQERYC